MTEPVDFEHERAQRRGDWIRWADQTPPDRVVIRLRGEVVMTGSDDVSPEDGSKFVRRGQALCLIPLDGGAMHMVRPPYRHLEWMPG